MPNTVQQFLQNRKLNHKKRLRLVAILLLLSLCVSAEVFWSLRRTGVAMAGEAHCGIIEHSHGDSCGENCSLEEHVHSMTCYSDENADREVKADWELSLSGVPFTDSLANDLVAVAKTQLGYTESTANFHVDENGVRHGYTRYGQWYGSPYGDWSSMFVAFCLYYTGVPHGVIPMYSGDETLRMAWEELGRYVPAAEHDPEKGDLVFLDPNGDGRADGVGILTEVTDSSLKLIAGDVNDAVSELAYHKSETTVQGYVPVSAVQAVLWESGTIRLRRSVALPTFGAGNAVTLDSSSQIIKPGGANSATDGTKVSKVIAGTGIENIFDITLTVETSQKIEEIYEEPDMAVVIVMDISNTMVTGYLSDGKSRYAAAVEAATDFLEHFAEEAGAVSEVGFVAFNTSAHKIFDLQQCDTQAQAAALAGKMSSETNKIISQYLPNSVSNTYYQSMRFTNIEGGLKMGWDMIKDSHCENKHIIFLSDGFPTTYLKNHNGTDYAGYDPNTGSGTKGQDGVFYDYVTGYYCSYGTSYSDKAAIYARQMATGIKNAGGKIFSIGIDIGGQTIAGYDGRTGLSVIDRSGKTYELGSADDPNAFKNWLGNKIGSGYYYDSTDTAGLKAAYDAVFDEIRRLREEGAKADWTSTDPLPLMGASETHSVEFIGFFDVGGNLVPLSQSNSLAGTHMTGAEDTVYFDSSDHQIHWDLKNSGYTSVSSGGVTYYKYEVVYRVRLRNECHCFVEHQEYDTNDVTTLNYRLIESVDGQQTISVNKTLNYPIPSVKGYRGEFTFQKVDPNGGAVAGAEFTLSHDTENCKICHGDGTSVTTVPDYVAVSDENGTVTFTEIPSGHRYKLTETGIPSGYLDTGRKYWASVSYDVTSVNAASVNGTAIEWDGKVLNLLPYDLPGTGGTGTKWYLIVGSTLIAVSLFCLFLQNKRRKQRRLC
ncbi:MAG: VWA domain-containing protein [Ruminococcaceae bacterium]|nr:VWA domain-containing protein [Oscillospiraceae bacterium]